ncbi:hypothetical protein [Wolbachia endosymbiont of Ctenocephalides felis wCfeJ]|uniref:hypothetical protein n=1 Tax=Wolbachia endosymbiont of Ctenocephalides felis wCfeJ TaxID=2732594 RepID=UPI001447EF04|nr:hypothetical protein [Wolbachia endosymbiont of Ctenocephalides felis wCfeJ]
MTLYGAAGMTRRGATWMTSYGNDTDNFVIPLFLQCDGICSHIINNTLGLHIAVNCIDTNYNLE